jgi:hypothetical protein
MLSAAQNHLKVYHDTYYWANSWNIASHSSTVTQSVKKLFSIFLLRRFIIMFKRVPILSQMNAVHTYLILTDLWLNPLKTSGNNMYHLF